MESLMQENKSTETSTNLTAENAARATAAPAALEYETVILARIGEIALKGLNRHKFLDRVVSNLAWRVKKIANYKVYIAESRIWVEPKDDAARESTNLAKVLDVCCRVFGIVSASKVIRFQGGLAEMQKGAEILIGQRYAESPLADHLLGGSPNRKTETFKIVCRRANKAFPLTSPEISRELGAYVLQNNANLSVDVHEPDFSIYVEVRDDISMYTEVHAGLKGLPVGTSSKGLLLLSGGIDSPVAGFQMASRGMEIEAIYFHTYPFTSDEAKEKVISLARILSEYTGRIKLHVVDFTDIQITLKKNVPQDMMTIVMRRMMMRIAEKIAEQNKLKCLITGESLGQVASQTAEALICTNAVCNLPVYRPLIGMDKDWTTDMAKFIGTYETSILPYEDCCTVFVAKHPKTRPSLKDAEFAENRLDIEALVAEGVAKTETLIVSMSK